MLNREDTKRLAELSRIKVDDAELLGITKEMDSILGYIGQIKETASLGEDTEEAIEIGSNYNVLREDENPTEPGTYSKDIIAEFPEREDNYLKVKKILNQE